eukprot:TRINITY_DN9514_c0_g1_i1.p1 TRINITY_DN9514_c0_g1~~TRINITY_DN9514_c0_g1_i1.p1  ORF type:complete len:663 (+),score=126.74 TRINITY_DN9514_c0_g1_i1:65-2053(+)
MSMFFNYVRKAVSRDRRRYRDGEFDLDLSYVTSRLVAMGFPGSGIEGAYRNNIDVVSRFLNEKHGPNYMVFNLADRKYDYAKFNYQVVDCGFWDHHPPPLSMLFEICHRMHSWLNADPEHVVVVHCVAGKGRTGLVISSYLLYARVSESIWQGLFHFAVQRSETEEGVSMPSQIRYAYLFSEVMSGGLQIHPRPMILKEIVLCGEFMPRIERDGFRPLLHVYSGRKLVHSSEWEHSEPPLCTSSVPYQRFTLPCRSLVFGDITIHMYHSQVGPLPVPFRRSNTLVFRASLHTSFLEQSAVQFPEAPEYLKSRPGTKGRSLSSSNMLQSPEPSDSHPNLVKRNSENEVDGNQGSASVEGVEAGQRLRPFDRFSTTCNPFDLKASYRESSCLSNSTLHLGWKQIRVMLLKEDLDGPHADVASRFPDDFSVEMVFECPPSSLVDQMTPNHATQALVKRREMGSASSVVFDMDFKLINLQDYIDDISRCWQSSDNLLLQALKRTSAPLHERSANINSITEDDEKTAESPQSSASPITTQKAESKIVDADSSPTTIEASPIQPQSVTHQKPKHSEKRIKSAHTRRALEFVSSPLDETPTIENANANLPSVDAQSTICNLLERIQLLQMENERLRDFLRHQQEPNSPSSPRDATNGAQRMRSVSGNRA